MGRRWTPEDDAALRELVIVGVEYRKIGRRLKRSEFACRCRATALGIKMTRDAVLENRKQGRTRFYRNAAKAQLRIKRLLKSYTPLDRAIRAEELRQRNKAGITGIKGKHHSEEARRRIGDAHRHPKSPETRAKMSEGAKRRWAEHRDGGQSAYRAAMLADKGRLRRLNDDECHDERRIWCAQCEKQVTASVAAACASPFCKAKEQAA